MKNRSFNFGFISFSLFFLFEPYLSTIDLFPDFVGFLILYFAIKPFADMNIYFFEARQKLKKVVAVNVLRFLSMALIIIDNVNMGEEFVMLYVTFFAILNAIFTISFIISLKQGTEYLANYANSKVINKTNSKGKTKNSSVFGFTLFYLIFKNIFWVIPELCVIFNESFTKNGIMIYGSQGMLRGIAFALCTIIGIIWLVYSSNYIRSIKKDNEFINGLKNVYVEKENSGAINLDDDEITKSTAMFSLFVIFSIAIFINNKNIIPLVISPSFLLFVESFRKNKKKLALIICSLVIFLSKDIYEYIFLSKHSYTQIFYMDNVYRAYIPLLVLVIISSILFIALNYLIISYYKNGVNLSIFDNDKGKKIKAKMNNRLVLTLILSIMRSLACVYRYISNGRVGQIFEASFTVLLIIELIYMALSTFFYTNIKNELKYKK